MYTYTYGLNNELREERIPCVGSITIPAYTWNRPATVNYPGGVSRTYTYDALMRLESLTVTDSGSTPLLNYQYTYDDVGNILTKVTEHGSYTYGYDDVSRLTSADNPTLPDDAFTYDGVGNRVTASNASGTIVHTANNELILYGEIKYDYDANGNLIQKRLGSAAINDVYDAANRLVQVEDDVTQVVIAKYGYDPFGRRLWSCGKRLAEPEPTSCMRMKGL